MADTLSTPATAPPARSHAVSDALGLWEPKRTLTLSAARAHTVRITWLRRALIAAAALLVASLIYHFVAQGPSRNWQDEADTSVRMLGPRYSGRTADGLPYYLKSKSATRKLESRNEVALIEPVLEFYRSQGAESSFVTAEYGRYDDVEKVLDLRLSPDGTSEPVVLETDDGVRCETTHARIRTRDKRIVGDEPIDCTGEFGRVSGQAYAVEDNYSTFVFKNGMTGRIVEDTQGATDRAATDQAATDQAANQAAPGADPMFAFGGDGPIDITARQATYVGGRTDLSGDVVVVQNDATVYSDDMVILRDARENEGAGTLSLGAVSTITGTGNFRYTSPDNDVRGDRGVYQRDLGRVTVTGNVRIRQPSGNTVSTDLFVYDTRTGQTRFSAQCRGEGCGSNGRTSITIER